MENSVEPFGVWSVLEKIFYSEVVTVGSRWTLLSLLLLSNKQGPWCLLLISYGIYWNRPRKSIWKWPQIWKWGLVPHSEVQPLFASDILRIEALNFPATSVYFLSPWFYITSKLASLQMLLFPWEGSTGWCWKTNSYPNLISSVLCCPTTGSEPVN